MLIGVIGGCFIGLFFLVLVKEAFGKKKDKEED